jgi:hypothetical protein
MYLIGQEKLLRLFIDCIVQWEAEDLDDSESFVLSHPDFDIQNFIVSPEGKLLGVIDWDGASTSPRSLGNKAYPGWLTRDWDPMMYGYEEIPDGERVPGIREDSPQELARYRKVYRDAMDRISRAGGSLHGNHETSTTLITANIMIATFMLVCRAEIMFKIFEELGLSEDIVYSAVCRDLGEDKLAIEVREALCTSFIRLLRAESL